VLIRTNAQLIAAAKGITPLEVLQGISGDQSLPIDIRRIAASEAAPYVHTKKPTALTGADGAPLIPPTINIVFNKVKK